MRMEHLQLEAILSIAKAIETDFPEFAVFYSQDSVGVDEVARLFGWGPATNSWEEYCQLRFLAGDSYVQST